MSLDHGLLNVPLVRRGDIDAQIDAYKAEAAKSARLSAKEAAARTAKNRELARVLLAAASDDRIEHLAKRCGKTPEAMRKHLKSECYWQPTLVIGLFS